MEEKRLLGNRIPIWRFFILCLGFMDFVGITCDEFFP